MRYTNPNRLDAFGDVVAAKGWEFARPEAMFNRHRPSSALRRGFTLIEMMIVVAIIMILVGAAATLIEPPGESRRIREAARMVNVYLSSARNRAMETGRPCGVVFRHFGNTACALNAEQCEVPPSYGGEVDTSTATVKTKTIAVGGTLTTLTMTFSDGDFTVGMVRPGDTFQLNNQGPFYTVAGTASNPVDENGFVKGVGGTATTSTPLTVFLVTTQGQMVPWATNSTVPYRIARSPVKGGARPLQLPSGSVVDLDFSEANGGVGARNLTVLFAPTGAVDCVYVDDTRRDATELIYLLIGKRNRMTNPFIKDNPNEGTMTNWQDLNNLWVTINPHTGVINTESVASSTGATTEANGVIAARTLAAQGQGMGGK